MNVKVYSTPTCPYCVMVKQYLSAHEISFTDYDVSQDRAAVEEMVNVSGQMGVPVVVIGDEVIVGFDKQKINALLGI